jgi:MFS family permease
MLHEPQHYDKHNILELILNTAEKKRFYGWIALSGAIVTYMAFGGCVLYSYGVFMPEMSADLSTTRSILSAPYGLQGLICGLMGPIIGLSVAKFGPRRNIVIGNLITGCSLIGMFFITEVWHIYVLFILLGFAIGFGTFNPCTTVANNWFIKRRSLAISLVVAAIGLGGLIFPMLISWLISTIGWRWSWAALGAIYILLAVIIPGILIRNKPEDIGQTPDGINNKDDEKNIITKDKTSHVYQTPIDWNVRDALQSRTFWMILIVVGVHTFNLNMLATQEVVYLQDQGFDPLLAASVWSLLIIVNSIAKLLMGMLGLRFESRHLAVAALASYGIGNLLLLNAHNTFTIYLSSIFNGIGYGGVVVLYPLFVGAYFGRKNYQRIIGCMSPFVFLIGFSSPIIAGHIFDITSNYFWAFILAITLVIIGMFCATLAKPPQMLKESGSKIKAP